MMYQTTAEPLPKQLPGTMSDEARHCRARGAHPRGALPQLSAAEIRERQEFALEAAVRMRDRFLQQEVWQRMDIDVAADPDHPPDPGRISSSSSCSRRSSRTARSSGRSTLRVPEGQKGWLRERFEEMDVIQFEDLVDTGDEYESLDAVAADPRRPRSDLAATAAGASRRRLTTLR
ncbi:MAG: hypothetical protein R2695_13060 [Acidimicrobiales bacterium]